MALRSPPMPLLSRYNALLRGPPPSRGAAAPPHASPEGEAAVLTFLRERDVVGGEMGFSFPQLYPLLSNGAFFSQAVAVLRDRGLFDRTAWGYGFLHGDVPACHELLQVEGRVLQTLGPFFESALVSVSAAEADFRHLDYHPIINKRAHGLGEGGAAPPILNAQLQATYGRFLHCLAAKPGPLGVEERLRLAYYLLCQDRVKEAAAQFRAAGAAGTSGGLKLQHDYMAAYLDLFDASGGLATARRVASEHKECPHAAWRARFEALAKVPPPAQGGKGRREEGV